MKTNTLDYLNQSLIDAIELAKSTGTNAVDFVKEQAPDVVNQLVAWEIAMRATYAILALLLLGFSIWGIKLCWKKMIGDDPFIDHPEFVFPGMIGLIAIGFGVCMFGYNLVALIKPIVAPKVWLIEYAANLLK